MRPPADVSTRIASQHSTSPPDYRVTHAQADGEALRTASHRLRALAALSGSLTDALTPEEAAILIEREALSVLGATSAVVVTLGSFPPVAPARGTADPAPVLVLVHAIGLPADVHAALRPMPLDATMPFAEVAREGEPIFLHAPEELRRYPAWADAMIGAGVSSAAVVPVWANGALRGVLALTWALPRSFDEDERAFVITLGVMCAQAIMRAHLRVAERRAREEAEEANRSKARFLATISHELRTPINAVMGYTQLLADGIYGAVTAQQKEHLGRVCASGTHLLELVEELLGYARVEAGEDAVRAAKVDLRDVVEQSMVLVRPLADTKGLNLRVEGHSDAFELFTDARKLRQILVNLMANAIKYTDRGDVVLLLRIVGAQAAARIYFEVTDTGRGIAVDAHERIFDAYWQEDNTNTNRAGSTGLGLSIARQLARLLGGDVLLAHTKIARGSTFVLSLPVIYSPPRVASNPPA